MKSSGQSSVFSLFNSLKSLFESFKILILFFFDSFLFGSFVFSLSLLTLFFFLPDIRVPLPGILACPSTESFSFQAGFWCLHTFRVTYPRFEVDLARTVWWRRLSATESSTGTRRGRVAPTQRSRESPDPALQKPLGRKI